MYTVKLHYFNKAGRHIGSSEMLSPGTAAAPLIEFIRTHNRDEICGAPPYYIYATPEVGEPVLIQLGGNR